MVETNATEAHSATMESDCTATSSGANASAAQLSDKLQVPFADIDLLDHPMLVAVSAARRGVAAGYGGPFGCSIVQQGRIIGVACNTVVRDHDPTCHAEMNCIHQVCQLLGTHDLSDCQLFTTCEPCPMCWGACKWARILKICIGAGRQVAAKYGFDDAAFYEELSRPIEQRRLAVVRRVPGIEDLDLRSLFERSATYQVRLKAGDHFLDKVFSSHFCEPPSTSSPSLEAPVSAPLAPVSAPLAPASGGESVVSDNSATAIHVKFARAAVETAIQGMCVGGSKQREPFAAVVVLNGEIIAKAYNTVVQDRDATATAEVNAIRQACKQLGTYLLSDCTMYCTAEPDLMSLCAIFWARISTVYVGLSQVQAARFGFEDGLIHLKELQSAMSSNANNGSEPHHQDACEQVFKEWAAKEDAVHY